ncbi:hypothetical protein B0H14DRAFT_3741057 [Mycena olivaceomarginata]|nr:hypothetical protein B0H14DRAFT_3741057 [Mycena olivaceomarginata]
MAFKNMKWADGFFPDLSGTVSAPGPSATQDDQESHTSLSSASPTIFSTPLASYSPLPGHQHTESSSRPNLSPIFVPTAFTSHLHSPTTFGTPDSGYQSGFTPASGTGFQFSPTSSLDRRGKRAYPADFDDPPPLYHLPEEDDDSDDEDYDYHTVVSDTERLLKLYMPDMSLRKLVSTNAGSCSVTAAASLDSHQTGNKCTYSPKYHVRAATAPPDPQTVPKTTPADACKDEVDFQNRCSSSAPPEDVRPPSPETHNPPINPDPTSPSFCAGVVVDWNIEAGPLAHTFPWHRVIHQGATESQLESFRIEIDSAEVTRAFSTKGLAYQPVGDKDSEIRKLCLQCVGLAKKLGNYIRKLTDYRRLAFAVAESNIPQLKQFLLRKLVNMLGDTFEGNTPNPHPSTDPRTINVTLMTYILGGRKLLYALSHANSLPSLQTLCNHMVFTRIMPAIGTISISDILHNIREVVLKPRAAAGRTTLRGVNLMVDEVALEERAVHFRHANSVGGLYWRHSPAVNLVLSAYDSALTLVKSLKEDRVHFSQEMMVVAASCFSESGTYPILALPTCKHVKAADPGTVYDAVMEAWRSSGAVEKVGRIWSWSTDGDMIHRIAGYEVFLTQKLFSTGETP